MERLNQVRTSRVSLVPSGILETSGVNGDSMLFGGNKQFPQTRWPVFRCLQNPLSGTNSYFRISRFFDSERYRNAPSTRFSMASDATNDSFWVLVNAGNPTSAHQSQMPRQNGDTTNPNSAVRSGNRTISIFCFNVLRGYN